MIDKITEYFPELTAEQKEQFEAMTTLYPEWNSKINVISRKDIDNLEVRHLLHSLAIGRFVRFTPGTRILDFGCGGGLPGLPLAVLFPEAHFHLIDRIGKKIRVATEIAGALGLVNVSFQHGDIAECKEKVDFVVSRAVMPLPDLIKLSRKNISAEERNGIPNGVITLKGGELEQELGRYKKMTEIIPLSGFFPDEEFFATKCITYTPVK